MDTLVFLAVLGAAMMHATWNAFIKIGVDRIVTVVLLATVQGVLAVVLSFFFPRPVAEAWPWVIASGCLHAGYKLFLCRAYSFGDLSQVYPLARGSAPLIVAVVGTIWLGEVLGPWMMAAVVGIGIGVILMSGIGPRWLGGKALKDINTKAVGLAFCTAGFTASYTMVDGIGARLAMTASGFVVWMTLVDTVVVYAVALWARGPKAFRAVVPALPCGALAGIFSYCSYWVAVWAMTQAPIALVAALRETSVMFGVLIGAVILKEPVGRTRWMAASLIAGGVILLRL